MCGTEEKINPSHLIQLPVGGSSFFKTLVSADVNRWHCFRISVGNGSLTDDDVPQYTHTFHLFFVSIL